METTCTTANLVGERGLLPVHEPELEPEHVHVLGLVHVHGRPGLEREQHGRELERLELELVTEHLAVGADLHDRSELR